LTLADGRDLLVDELTAHLGTLPSAGDDIPIQGWAHNGTIFVDSRAHSCTTARPGVRGRAGVTCSVGGERGLVFPNEAAAAAYADEKRTHAAAAYRRALGLSEQDAHLDPAPRRAQGSFAASQSAGVRNILMWRVMLFDQNNLTAPVSAASAAIASSGMTSFLNSRSWGAAQANITIAPCLYVLSSNASAYASNGPLGASDLWRASKAALDGGSAAGLFSGVACPAFDYSSFRVDHFMLLHPSLGWCVARLRSPTYLS